MDLTVRQSLDDDSGRLWKLYQRAFDDLRVEAVQRHVMHRDEFDGVVDDERVTKYLVVDEQRDTLAALATMTNDLDAVPLISPEYFAHRWPRLYEAGDIWFVPFVAVDPDYQGTGAMNRIIGRMCDEVSKVGGVVCLDVSEGREASHRLPSAIERLVNTYSPGTKRRRLDAQVFWAYEFPTPA